MDIEFNAYLFKKLDFLTTFSVAHIGINHFFKIMFLLMVFFTI